MAATAEQIERDFLQKAIKGGVAGDLNGVTPGEDYQYDGDPRDLDFIISPQEAEPTMGDEAPAEEFATREIEASRMPRVITLGFKDGTRWEGEIPPLTMERLDMLSVHQTQVSAAERRLTNSAERGDAKGIARFRQEAFNAKKAMFKFALPTFPEMRYRDLLASAYVAVINQLDDMQNEMTTSGRASGPNR